MDNYNPRKNSFPDRTIKYLKEHGESKASDIRNGIGLDEWCINSAYADRSSYYFHCTLIPRLLNKKIVIRTRHGHYKLV